MIVDFLLTRLPVSAQKLVWSPVEEKVRRRLLLVLTLDLRHTSATKHRYISR
jgi:hypothetical protein